MKELDLYNHCLYFFDCFSLPIRIKTPQLNHCIPAIWTNFEDPRLSAITIEQPSYLIFDNTAFYGIIPCLDEQTQLIIGPVLESDLTEIDLGYILAHMKLGEEEKLTFIDEIRKIPLLSHHRFLFLLTYLYFNISGKKIDSKEIQKVDTSPVFDINPILVGHLMANKEEENYHNSYQFELRYLKAVETGNLLAFQHLGREVQHLKPGILANNSLRHNKNLAISSITMMTRAAIRGGLDIEEAYLLSDLTIQEVEKMTSLDGLNHLIQDAAINFINRVAQQKIPNHLTPLVRQAVQLIHQQINQPISAATLADQLAVNRSYLSRRFKKEINQSISEFIKETKLREASDLLIYTDMTINQIANYLYFSSQSHLQNNFKAHYGMTPLTYRKTQKVADP